MRVRFCRHYQTYRRGQCYDLGDGVARSMMQMGVCEPAPQSLFENAAAPEPEKVERAIAPVAKKRGRPRKKRAE